MVAKSAHRSTWSLRKYHIVSERWGKIRRRRVYFYAGHLPILSYHGRYDPSPTPNKSAGHVGAAGHLTSGPVRTLNKLCGERGRKVGSGEGEGNPCVQARVRRGAWRKKLNASRRKYLMCGTITLETTSWGNLGQPEKA